MQLNNDEIRSLLPHRFPFLMVDRVIDGQPGQWAKGIKCVSAGEPYFVGHFPHRSLMPGVLILEALAQVGGVALMTKEENRGKLAVFGGVKNARFRRQVTPGDVLTLECHITRQRGPVGIGTATATVDGQPVCTAELTFALVDDPSALENLSQK